MKSNRSLKIIRPGLPGAILVSAILASASLALAQTEFKSPVGDWDFIISGAERGVAFLSFSQDESGLGGSIIGYEVVTPVVKSSSASDYLRGGEDIGRSGVTDTNAASGGTVTRLLGFALISGTWAYDVKGQPVGVYTEGNLNITWTTNEVTDYYSEPITNADGEVIGTRSYETNVFVGVATTNAITNGISFTSVVTPGKRMSIKTTSDIGKTTLTGLPTIPGADISGTYYAEVKQGSKSLIELLALESDPEYPFVFDMVGVGAGYNVDGGALLSRKGQLALVVDEPTQTRPLISVFGSFNPTTGRGTLKGYDLNNNKVTYKLYKQP
jgi:hypothetical protein